MPQARNSGSHAVFPVPLQCLAIAAASVAFREVSQGWLYPHLHFGRPTSLSRATRKPGAGFVRSSRRASQQDSVPNLWREAPEEALKDALAQADAKWLLLQTEADATSTDRGAAEQRCWRAAALMAASALDRLRPYTIPAVYVDIPPLRGAEDALLAFLGPEVLRLVFNFLSEVEQLSSAGRAFWQAELYLRELDAVAGDTEVKEAAAEAQEKVEAEPEEMQKALRGSVLLARQNYISAARFGYFLRRGLQRLELEKSLGQGSATSLSDWMERLAAADAVELARAATREAQRAVQHQATELFGSEVKLMRQLDYGPKAVDQLQLSGEGVRRLKLEAAAFGAALFDAEAAAARRYKMSLHGWSQTHLLTLALTFRRGLGDDLGPWGPWAQTEGEEWRSRHLCWGGVSPPAHALGTVFEVPAEEISCEFRNICYRTGSEEFIYSEDEEMRPPPVSIWSGSADTNFGGYDPPRKILPMRMEKESMESERPRRVLTVPTYVILRGDSSNWGHMINEMMLPLTVLISQAEGDIRGETNGRVVFFLDDCDPLSIYNSPPAMPKIINNTQRRNCERISDMLISIVSDWSWLDVERLGLEELCFSRLVAGSGRFGLFSGYGKDGKLSGLHHDVIASGLFGTHMRLLRDWAYSRLLGTTGSARSRADGAALGFALKPKGVRRAVANGEEVKVWLRDWAKTKNLEYLELRLWTLSLEQQLQVLQRMHVWVTHGGSTHTASSIFLPDWASVVVIPQCGGCKPTEDIQQECSEDSLYSRPCSVEEMTFDHVWPRPLLKILWYPASLQDTEERVGHLDLKMRHELLIAVLEKATLGQ
eukprot:s637_g14.t1